MAITTSSIAVASRCPWARAGVGAVATQNITDPRLGQRGLDLMASGLSAPAALQRLLAEAHQAEYRQVTIIDRAGGTATPYWRQDASAPMRSPPAADCVAAGNLLSNRDVPGAMVRSFVTHPDMHLADRLLLALEAGQVSGGEMGPVKSAGLLVVHEQPWPLVDLRVDGTTAIPFRPCIASGTASSRR